MGSTTWSPKGCRANGDRRIRHRTRSSRTLCHSIACAVGTTLADPWFGDIGYLHVKPQALVLTERREIDVLLVEDSPHDAELVLRALKNHRIPYRNRLVVARDGPEAFEMLFPDARAGGDSVRLRPKVVVLDLKLPTVSGLEVLRRLRSDERTALVPVVVFTASREDRDLAEGYERGVNSYVVKPADAEDFARAVVGIASYWLSLNELPYATG